MIAIMSQPTSPSRFPIIGVMIGAVLGLLFGFMTLTFPPWYSFAQVTMLLMTTTLIGAVIGAVGIILPNPYFLKIHPEDDASKLPPLNGQEPDLGLPARDSADNPNKEICDARELPDDDTMYCRAYLDADSDERWDTARSRLSQ